MHDGISTYMLPTQESCRTHHSYTLSTLLSLPLGEIAAEMQSKVDIARCTLAYHTRSLATFISQPGNSAKANLIANMNFGADILLLIWTKIKGYGIILRLGLGN